MSHTLSCASAALYAFAIFSLVAFPLAIKVSTLAEVTEFLILPQAAFKDLVWLNYRSSALLVAHLVNLCPQPLQNAHLESSYKAPSTPKIAFP